MQYLQAIIREIIPNNFYKLLNTREIKKYIQTIIRKIISSNTYKLSSDKLFQTIFTFYYQGNRMLHTNFCQKKHFKQYLQTIF